MKKRQSIDKLMLLAVRFDESDFNSKLVLRIDGFLRTVGRVLRLSRGAFSGRVPCSGDAIQVLSLQTKESLRILRKFPW